MGTVSYHLDAVEGGGHYITNLLESKNQCIEIHEAEINSVRKKPDFGSDTVIVALKKIGESFRLPIPSSVNFAKVTFLIFILQK